MKLLSIYCFFIFFISLTSCSNVVYKQAIPSENTELTAFPNDIQGEYVNNENDTLTINANDYFFGEKNDLIFLSGELNAELVLKELSGYYFLNFKNTDGYWETIIAYPQKEKITIYCIDVEDKKNIKIINSKIKHGKAKSIRKNGKYIIDPTKDEILNILQNEDICKETVLRRLK